MKRSVYVLSMIPAVVVTAYGLYLLLQRAPTGPFGVAGMGLIALGVVAWLALARGFIAENKKVAPPSAPFPFGAKQRLVSITVTFALVLALGIYYSQHPSIVVLIVLSPVVVVAVVGLNVFMAVTAQKQTAGHPVARNVRVDRR